MSNTKNEYIRRLEQGMVLDDLETKVGHLTTILRSVLDSLKEQNQAIYGKSHTSLTFVIEEELDALDENK